MAGVESLHAPVYVTIIQKHKQADFYKNRDTAYHEDSYEDLHKSQYSGPYIEPYDYKINDKFDRGKSYYPIADSLYYDDKYPGPKKVLHEDPYKQFNTYVNSKSRVTKDTYYNPNYGYENEYVPIAGHKNVQLEYKKTPHPYEFLSAYHPNINNHPIKQEKLYLTEPKSEHKYPEEKSISYLQSKYYTHTPKPKRNYEPKENPILHPANEYSNHALRRVNKEVKHPSHYEAPLPEPHYKLRITPEKHVQREVMPTLRQPEDGFHLEKAIGDVRAEFKKGSRNFDFAFSKDPSVKFEEKDMYKTTHFHETVYPKLHYEEIKPYVKSYSVEGLPPPKEQYHQPHTYIPYNHDEHFLNHNIHHRPRYYHSNPEKHYEIVPEIHYEQIEPQFHYDFFSHEEPPSSYFSKPKYYHQPRYVPAPPPLPPILDPVYHSHYPSGYPHGLPVSNKYKAVSKNDKSKSTRSYKYKSGEIHSYGHHQNQFTRSFMKENKSDKQTYPHKSEFSLPVSFVIQKQEFPAFSGPETIKIHIGEKIRSNLHSALTHDVPPFSVSETEAKPNRRGSKKGVSHQGRHLSSQKQKITTLRDHRPSDFHDTTAFTFKYTTDLVNRTDTRKFSDHNIIIGQNNLVTNYLNRTTPIMRLALPSGLNNGTDMKMLLSEMLQLKNNDDIEIFSKTSEEVIFIIVDETKNEKFSVDLRPISEPNIRKSSNSKESSDSVNTQILTDLSHNEPSNDKTTHPMRHNIDKQLENAYTYTNTLPVNPNIVSNSSQLSSKTSKISFPNSSTEVLNTSPKKKFIQLLLGTENNNSNSSPNGASTFIKTFSNEMQLSQISALSGSSLDIPPSMHGGNSQRMTMLSSDSKTTLSPVSVITVMNSNLVNLQTQSQPMKLMNNFPTRPPLNKRNPLMIPSSNCQCNLIPKVDPRRTFSPRFLNATSIVQRLLGNT